MSRRTALRWCALLMILAAVLGIAAIWCWALFGMSDDVALAWTATVTGLALAAMIFLGMAQ